MRFNKVLIKIKAVLLLVLMAFVLFACKKHKVIKPLYEKVDMNNLPNGIYYVGFTKDKIKKGDVNYIICDIYSQDIYDTVELHNLQVGDIIEKGGERVKVEKIVWDDQQSSMCINYWDNVNDADERFVPMESGGTYIISGPDDHATYTKRGTAKVKLANNCVFNDSSDLDNPTVTVKGAANVVEALTNAKLEYFVCLNTKIRIENGECVEINRRYIP